jgi:hypothetical protein
MLCRCGLGFGLCRHIEHLYATAIDFYPYFRLLDYMFQIISVSITFVDTNYVYF